jgi:hypothetical protein
MKRKILELVAFIIFVGSLGYIMGTFGNLQLDYISMGQAVIQSGIGLVVFALDTVLINYLGKDGEWL